MKRLLAGFMVLSLFTGLAVAQEVVSEAKAAPAAAIEAAQAWLKLVDDGQYAESWSGSAQYLKGNVAEDQWATMLKGVRVPLGTVISRTVKTAQPMTSLPGAPDGEYVVIRFETSLSNKKAAFETVTVVKEPQDGVWRVAGYLIA